MSEFDALFPPEIVGPRPVLILDGGMGTTLQSPPFNLASALESNLWSSELLRTPGGRSELFKLHQTWIDSGAEILGSCTYQSSLPLFLGDKDTFTEADIKAAKETMLSALPIITSPKLTPRPRSRLPPLAALSLGPFGAQLQPAQEYSGLYPPPFGKDSPSKFAYSDSATRACPLPLDRVGRAASNQIDGTEEDHLAAWHLARLEQFAESDAFKDISMIAFETVPNLYETRAIRRAMKVFELSRKTVASKPWYISYVFPLNKDGEPRLPDKETNELSLEAQMELLAQAALALSKNSEKEFATPSGVGINCTSPLHLSSIVAALAASIKRVVLTFSPWIILYPDGGAVYDVQTRTWKNPAGLDDVSWASKVANVVQEALEFKRDDGESVFGGVVAGGCCKAGPGAIKELRGRCEERGLKRK